tara:strand:+ start:251 stop:1297 length:1047 start_codon:yes stop_codon:yes gene_type:complete
MKTLDMKKDEIMNAIISIDNEDILNRILGVCGEEKVIDAFGEFEKSGTSLNGVELEYFKTELLGSTTAVESKIELLSLLSSNEAKIGAEFFSFSSGNFLTALDSRISSNETFLDIFPALSRYTSHAADGLGKMEMVLLLCGKNASKPDSKGEGKKGDVIIDGLHVEVKCDGGMMHAGNVDVAKGYVKTLNKMVFDYATDNGHRIPKGVDNSYFSLASRKNKGKWGFDVLKEMDTEEAIGLMTEYFSNLYTTFTEKEVSSLVDEVIPALGDDKKVASICAKYVMDGYKRHEKWDSIIVFDTKTSNFGIATDGKSLTSTWRCNLPSLSRGKSTYAVPDGSVIVNVDNKEV